ncbi:MAG: LCP family protein [Lachnospiraceae bacterium]|nr:LCP family protein [Lachnospiraceae bacterium]
MNDKKAWAKKNIPFIVIELIVLALSIGVLYIVTLMTHTVKKVDLEPEKIVINNAETTESADPLGEGKTAGTDTVSTGTGVINIALFGVDSRDGNLSKRTRSDTMIIASIDQDNHVVRLISVYRDSYLNLGNDTYSKANAAYAKGGPEQAINMLNMNLDLDITDYVTVGFEGLSEAVDALGGVEIDIAVDEISHLNNYQRSMYINEDGTGELNEDIIEVYDDGLQTLNGLQATAYCRIRYTAGNDYKRAERQRTVITKLLERASSASISKLSKAAMAILPHVETSLKADEIMSLLSSASEYSVAASDGLPFENNRYSAKVGVDGWCIVPVSLEDNARALHELLYPGEEYTPSATVQEISRQINERCAPYIQ